MSRGLFGWMFDFNGDGDLDAFEQAAEFMFFQQLMRAYEGRGRRRLRLRRTRR